ncbi:MAG: prepilin-type N-terminal cleavage/methylation domain-containing protein [Acidimicrobiia bacterium]|nr:prepilin-type N-terminal cleavage/methylation domain-containing protein [Acidimicrobiia bacterium]MDH5504193.1 prepilin-type N-terminal cleavage/methylation domain-containing protein [Acidimicrobiia bacterium]
MISWMRNRLNKEEGFTLVELMVVVLIIAILIAIAIPTFLGARERAQDRAAQSNLRNALTSAKVHYTDEEDFSDGAGADVTPALLNAIEPSLTFVAGAIAVGANQVGFVVENNSVNPDRQVITFTTDSASGTTFCISDVLTNGTYNSGTTYGSDLTGADLSFTRAECAATDW